jgi:hypothetical protein
MTSNIHRVAVRKLNHWNSLHDFDELIFDKCDSTVQDVHESLRDLQGMAFAADGEVNVSDVRKIGCVQECMLVRGVACCMRCFNARFRSAECEEVCDVGETRPINRLSIFSSMPFCDTQTIRIEVKDGTDQ